MQELIDEINARDLPAEVDSEEEEEASPEDSNYSTALYNLFCHHHLQAFNFQGVLHHSHLFLLPSFQDLADAEDAEGEEEEGPEDVETIDPIVEPSPPENELEDGSGVPPGSSTDRVVSSPSAARTEIDDEQNEVDEAVVTPTSARVSKADEIYERYGLICPDVDTPLEMILPDNQLGLDPPHEFELHGIEDIEVSQDDGEEWAGPPLYRSLAMEPIDVDSLENDENDGSASASGLNHTVWEYWINSMFLLCLFPVFPSKC